MVKKKLLVVDDDETTVDFIKALLEMSDYEVFTAYTGKECLDKMRKEKIDLLLLDIMMDDIDGWEVLEEMEKDGQLRDIPVLIVSAKTQPVDKMLAFGRYEVDDYIIKPFGNKELLEKVKNLLKD